MVVLCILTATTFWILNALNKDNYTTVVDQPIEFYYDRDEYMAVEELPSKIRIEVNGNGWDLLRKYFKVKVVPFPIELSDPSAQDYLLPTTFQRSLAEQTAPTQITAILEDTLKIKIDKIVEEKLKVLLDSSANPLGRNIRFASDVIIEPDCVTVKGPTSIVNELRGSLYLDLKEKDLREDFSKPIPLSLPEERENFLTLAEKEVIVSFDVVEFLEGNRTLKLKKINFPSKVSLEEGDSTVVIEYLVDERERETLSDMKLEALLNFSNRNREDSTITAKLNRTPAFLDSVRFVPDQFKLIYE